MLVSVLDKSRARILRGTMRYAVLRWLYLSRPRRLATHYLLVFSASIFLASHFPLWLLAIGPVFYGLPHLLSSFRYGSLPATSKNGHAVILLAALSALVAVIRLRGFFPENNFPELFVLGITLVALPYVAEVSRPRKITGLLFLTLTALSWNSPLVVLGFFILGHNFVGFFYWIQQSRNRDRRLAFAAFLLFILAHLWIFQSSFAAIGWTLGEMSVWKLGSQIFPHAGINPNLWARAVVAYAFGQSVHYFVWLRVIPELHLKSQTPTSFAQSLYWLKKDLGKRVAYSFLGLVSALSLVWLLFRYSLARDFYLAAASFHGYAELAGLFLIRVRTVPVWRVPYLPRFFSIFSARARSPSIANNF